MRISAEPLFFHAGHLTLPPESPSKVDPRSKRFSQEKIDIDLRECEFIGPEAALWCAVYSSLAVARGAHVRLLVPDSMAVCIHLKSAGLFHTLQEAGVEVDARGVPDRSDTQAVVPIVRFSTETEANALTNDALEALVESGLGLANLNPVVSEAFGELAANAVQHADSEVGAYGLIQFYESEKLGKRFVCAVADGGIGIRRSLERNPEHQGKVAYDWEAIELALGEFVSGTGSPTRGIGLFGTAQDMREGKGSLLIHSGQGLLRIDEGVDRAAHRAQLFPGTLASATIPA